MVVLLDLSRVVVGDPRLAVELVRLEYGEEIAQETAARFEECRPQFQQLLRGEITEKQFWDKFFNVFRVFPFYRKHIKEMISNVIKQEVPGTKDVLFSITRGPTNFSFAAPDFHGCPPIYVVSDYSEKWASKVKEAHRDFFNKTAGQFWSYERSAIKSDPGFFQNLLSELSLSPDEVVFIDDQDDNIRAAEQAGIFSIKFQGALKLYYALTGKGFRFSDIPWLR